MPNGQYPASGPGPTSLPPAAPPQLPGWLGPIVTITTQVGVPTVVAGVLLWFVLFRLDKTLTVIERREEDRVHIIAAMQDTLVAALERQTRATETIMRENIMTNKETASRLENVFRDSRRDQPPSRPYGPPLVGEYTPHVGDEGR